MIMDLAIILKKKTASNNWKRPQYSEYASADSSWVYFMQIFFMNE